ncbi:MAG: response regulator [Opitutae bacterium]|nr:response regulator [Opitutae bacterium]
MKILHLDDNPHDQELVAVLLNAECPECEIVPAATRPEFLTGLASGRVDVVLSDYTMPGFDGLEALALTHQHAPDVPFVFFSGSIGEDQAIAAVRAGAADYVIKDRHRRLPTALRRAVLDARERRRLRETENSLRAMHERYQRFIETARDAIFSLSSNGVITTLNPAFETITGWPRGEWVGQSFIRLVDPLDTERAKRRFGDILAGDDPGVFMLRLRTARGAADVEFTLSRGQTADGALELMGIGRDVTETRRLQEQFLRAQRMENLGLLAAGIAHDFNNILTPMLMVSQLLREQSPPESRRLLDTLEHSAARGASLVKQILSFAQGGGDELRVVQLKHVARDIIAMVEETFPRNVRLEQSVPSDLWPVRANVTQIHQVLLNLCVNARDAMPHGGALSLRLENRSLDAGTAARIPGGRPGAFLRLEIGDTGSGIAPDVLPHIWEPFFTTKEAGRGTGLGLSTVRGILARHEGFCDVTSTLGRGTKFSLYLPAEPTSDTDAPSTESTALPRANGELVLVVEDEPEVRTLVQRVLQQQGYRVVAAENGAEARRWLDDPPFAHELRVIVTDMIMPRIGGRELVEHVRQRLPHVRILVMSGFSSGGKNHEAIGDAFLLKPFRHDALLRQVHALLGRTTT